MYMFFLSNRWLTKQGKQQLWMSYLNAYKALFRIDLHEYAKSQIMEKLGITTEILTVLPKITVNMPIGFRKKFHSSHKFKKTPLTLKNFLSLSRCTNLRRLSYFCICTASMLASIRLLCQNCIKLVNLIYETTCRWILKLLTGLTPIWEEVNSLLNFWLQVH